MMRASARYGGMGKVTCSSRRGLHASQAPQSEAPALSRSCRGHRQQPFRCWLRLTLLIGLLIIAVTTGLRQESVARTTCIAPGGAAGRATKLCKTCNVRQMLEATFFQSPPKPAAEEASSEPHSRSPNAACPRGKDRAFRKQAEPHNSHKHIDHRHCVASRSPCLLSRKTAYTEKPGAGIEVD